ncbi:MAG: hypothetical protein H6Q90_5768, partial [Deltaproteobacteria bacterium]|nr:hypothetical protein [Deltaproteobacteria bacterium]
MNMFNRVVAIATVMMTGMLGTA